MPLKVVAGLARAGARARVKGTEARRTRETGGERTRRRREARTRMEKARAMPGKAWVAFQLWTACALTVLPQIVLGGLVGAGAQWLKVAMCDASQRYSTTCRYAFSIDGHLAVSAALSFLLVFRAVQAFRRFEDGKEALAQVKEALRNLAAVVECESSDAPNVVDMHDDVRRLCNLAYAFMRQSLRESRYGIRDVALYGGEVDCSNEALLYDDCDGTPSVIELASEEEREKYEKLRVENRPEAVIVELLCLIESSGALYERASIEAYRESQRALNSYRRALMIIDTPTPTQYTHAITILLFTYVFSLPFALTVRTDWRTPLVSATVAWLFYGVNEIACALEDPFNWVLPAHPLNAIGRRIQREMDAFRLREDVTGIGMDEGLLVEDSLNYQRWRGRFWFITDCFAWKGTTLPLIGKQLILAIVIGMAAQLLKIGVCGDSVTDSSQCLLTFDSSAHKVLAIPVSFLLVTNAQWGYERFISSKLLVVNLQNELRGLMMCASIFIEPRNGKLNSIKEDVLEVERSSSILFGFTRIVVRELLNKAPSGSTATLSDCLANDRYGGTCSLSDLLTDTEIAEVKSLPANALVSWAAVKINACIDKYRRSDEISERFGAEAYRRICSAMQCVQGLLRVTTTPVPKHFQHLMRLSLFFYVFTTPFVFSVTYQWITCVPVLLVVIGFYGIAETSTGLIEPFSWSGPRHDLGDIGTCMLFRHERIRALAFHHRREHADWSALEDEQNALSTQRSLGRAPSRKRFYGGLQKLLQRAPSVNAEVVEAQQEDERNASLSNVFTFRKGWKFFTGIFVLRETVLPALAAHVVLAGAIALGGNALKIYSCGDNVTDVAQCAYTFDATAHVMGGSIIGFTLVFRMALSYVRYYDGKGMIGAMVNAIRCLNIGVSTMLRSTSISASANVLKDIDESAVEIRRLGNMLLAFLRQAIRERRHGVEPSAIIKQSPSPGDFMEDPQGWPSLSILLRDDEKLLYEKVDCRTRVGLCASKIIRIIEEHRKLGHVSERDAFEMLGRVEACVGTLADIERLLDSGMPFPFIHLMNFVLFWFVMTAPFVFITSYKWIAPFPSMLVAASLFGIAEIGRLMEDPFGWDEPKHDLNKAGWGSYTETLAIHETAAGIFDKAGGEASTHSGVDALILSGAAAPKALQEASVLQKIRRKRAVDSGVSYFSALFTFRNTIFPYVWPMMVVMMVIGIGAQWYKLATCGDDVTDHRQCGTTLAPDAAKIVGRMTMFILVYRFFFAFRVFIDAKTGVYAAVSAIYMLNVQACSHLRDGDKIGRDTRYAVLRLSCALFAVMRQGLRGSWRDEEMTKSQDARTLFLDERADSHLSSLLDEDGEKSYEALLDMSREERVAEIATRLLHVVEYARKSGCLSNRGAAMMVNTTQAALHAFTQCSRAKSTKVPYALQHMINLVVFIWMFGTASVIVVPFKYVTWLPLGILSLTLYGLLAIAQQLEDPFVYQGMCSNDLTAFGHSLWSSCAATHVGSTNDSEMKTKLDSLAKRVESRKRDVAQSCHDRTSSMFDSTALVPSIDYDSKDAEGWTFPKQRVFVAGRLGIFRELFTVRGTLIMPALPYMIFTSGVAMALYFLSKAVCTDDEIFQTARCKALVAGDAHVLAAPVLSFCIAYLLNLTHRRYYAGRQFLDNIFDHARDIVIELKVAFCSRDDAKAHSAILRDLNALVAFVRQSVRESRTGYPIELTSENAKMPNTVLDDDFFGAPSTKELLTPELRNVFAGIAPAFRVNRCAANLKRSLGALPRETTVHEQRYYRIYRSINGILDAWTDCEMVVGTPIPAFYMSTIYSLIYVYILTSPLVFIHSYGFTVFAPVATLTFLVIGIVKVSEQMMSPFRWSPTSHNMNSVTTRVHRLSELSSSHASAPSGAA